MRISVIASDSYTSWVMSTSGHVDADQELILGVQGAGSVIIKFGRKVNLTPVHKRLQSTFYFPNNHEKVMT